MSGGILACRSRRLPFDCHGGGNGLRSLRGVFLLFPRMLTRRAALLGLSSLAAGCASAQAPTGRHAGLYHFTVPRGRPIETILRDLQPLLGTPTTIERVVDLGRPGIDAGDIVTVRAAAHDNRTATNLAEQVSAQLRLPDFEPDIELVHDEEPRGRCDPDPAFFLGDDPNPCLPPHDTPADLVWHLRNMRVPQAWALSKQLGRPAYGQDVRIGHVDTGVAPHVELESGVLFQEGFNLIEGAANGFDPVAPMLRAGHISHGTGTASLIVARGDVGPVPMRPGPCGGKLGSPGRLVGTAPLAYLVPARATYFTATIGAGRLARAVNRLCDQGVGVITIALGTPFYSKVLHTAIRAAVARNVIVVAAAGNFIGSVVYPAKYTEAIAIGATGPNDEVWCGTCRGGEIVASAPGDKVWRAVRRANDGGKLNVIGPRHGSSFSVSLIAGIAALWLAHHGRENLLARGGNLQETFRALLAKTARKPVGWEQHDGELGAGIVDARALLAAEPLVS
jgi:subtilisin family serine protease